MNNVVIVYNDFQEVFTVNGTAFVDHNLYAADSVKVFSQSDAETIVGNRTDLEVVPVIEYVGDYRFVADEEVEPEDIVVSDDNWCIVNASARYDRYEKVSGYFVDASGQGVVITPA